MNVFVRAKIVNITYIDKLKRDSATDVIHSIPERV
jgi:hypothetical protein